MTVAAKLKELLAKHHVLVPTDNAFQQRARLLQALWREEQRLPAGEHRGRKLGSRLEMPAAQTTLSNYLTDTIRAVVRREVLDPKNSAGKLFGEPRIFNDLLSSQPLCFNLFGELQQDLSLASRALRQLTEGRIEAVTAIGFEHSPGRRDPKYTGDRSAFDVFIEFMTPKNARGFVGVEVKYHESLGDPPAEHRPRYDEVAKVLGCFAPATYEKLKDKPLQQIWRDHLLVGSLLHDKAQGYDDAFFAFAYPKDNECCSDAVASYRKCLSSATSFVPWTLENLVGAVKAEGGGWVDAVARRYLAFEKVDALAGK
jgi:hypothetical protein